jgi:hypothetical protein
MKKNLINITNEFEFLRQFNSNYDRIFGIYKITDDDDGLSIFVKDHDELHHVINFSQNVGYQNFDEFACELYNQELDVTGCGVYAFKNSEFVNYANKLNMVLDISEDVIHFRIISRDNFLEILSFDPPNITKIE